jgi:hypothetical protein
MNDAVLSHRLLRGTIRRQTGVIELQRFEFHLPKVDFAGAVTSSIARQLVVLYTVQ